MLRVAPAPIIALAVLFAAGSAGAVDYPTLKSGQWEMTTTTHRPGAQPQTSTICFDAALQQEMIDLGAGMRRELCTRNEVRQVGAQFITDTECRFGNSVVKSRAVMTMKGDTAYRTEAETTYDPPLVNDLRQAKTIVEAKYVGACRDGLVPGDIVTGNGQKLNLRQIEPDRPPKTPK